MNKFMFLLLMSFYLNGQTLINETFSNYYDSTKTNTELFYMLDSLNNNSVNVDLSGNYTSDLLTFGNTLYVQNSPLISGGWTRAFDGNSSMYNTTTGSLSMKSVVVWFKSDVVKSTTSHEQVVTLAKYGGFVAGIHIGPTTAALTNEIITSADSTNHFSAFNTAGDSITAGWHSVALIWNDVATGYNVYLDGVNKTTVEIGNTHAIFDATAGIALGENIDGHLILFNGQIAALKAFNTVLTIKELKELLYLPIDWMSLNGGVTRSNYEFSQGVVNDTIYYNTELTAGGWSITLSDSAASGVNYEVLTSADANTWTTLASGTTGTSWSSKSYSGTGAGYVAIAVASGTAFFDDLTVFMANDNLNSNSRSSGLMINNGYGEY